MSREKILQKLKQNCHHDIKRESFEYPKTTYHDKIKAFEEALKNAGGELVHTLDGIDVDIVLKAKLGVCENGAVWIDAKDLQKRSDIVLPKVIAIKLHKKNLVHNMHEALNKISFDNIGYGVFLSGASKTADIEQSLVIGAHGSLRLLVYLEGEDR